MNFGHLSKFRCHFVLGRFKLSFVVIVTRFNDLLTCFYLFDVVNAIASSLARSATVLVANMFPPVTITLRYL